VVCAHLLLTKADVQVSAPKLEDVRAVLSLENLPSLEEVDFPSLRVVSFVRPWRILCC
jgi:hypothetical protein